MKILNSSAKLSATDTYLNRLDSSLRDPLAVQRVHCPTCGSFADRYHNIAQNIVRTQCDCCDYLMVSCSQTGRVIESYSPTFYSLRSVIQ